jgi:Na+/H+ antiporter NhaD/arsenite permease-like protein
VSPAWVSLFAFVLCYALFVVFPHRRSWTACGGALLAVALGALPWRDALLDKVDWNVMGLFLGTLVLAELFMESRVPAVLAEWLVDHTRTVRGAMLALCALSGAISMFVENVAVVLLVAPVALSLTRRLGVSPVRLLILIAACSNLQGTATMIGDPPSMILAGYMHLSFWDFFVYQGQAGIFFAVQAGAAAALLVGIFLLRRFRDKPTGVPQEKARALLPSLLLALLVVGLSFSTLVDPAFEWFAGALTLALAAVGLAWYHAWARWGRAPGLLWRLDWDTTFFLMGVFVVVGAVSDTGWLDALAGGVTRLVHGSPLGAFLLIVGLSVALSAFVDNVPFLLAMIPVAQKVADGMGAPVPLLLFGLLIGACLGGNITPIGASANVVVVGLLRKEGQVVTFREFMGVGVPFTAAAVTAACALVWCLWAP